MDEINDEPVVEETTEDIEEIAPRENETTDDKEARLKRLEENAIRQRERTRALKAENEKLKKAIQPVSKEPSKTSELDETQLDYLDLKGISETEDIDLIQKVMARTGNTVRQALKDEYVQEKLKANQAKREVAAATPSSTKRSGSQGTDLALAIAKYEQSGFKDLPDDFALRSAVINSVVDKNSQNKPSWH